MGFVYLSGMGAQVEGQNLLLLRDALLDPAQSPAARIAQWRTSAVPIAEFVDALMGPENSPRLLVVDAAYQHPGLAGLPAAGLAAQKLPPGMIALFGNKLGALQEVPAVAALPSPPPSDPRQIAASPFARALVAQLAASRVTGPDALRATRRALFEGSLGQFDPWLSGDTDSSEAFAENSMLDSLVPRSPEDVARELGRKLLNGAGRSAEGEQSVAEVLQQARPQPPSLLKTAGDATFPEGEDAGNSRPSSARNALREGQSLSPQTPGAPSLPSATSGLGSALSTAAGAAGTALSVAGTAASEIGRAHV